MTKFEYFGVSVVFLLFASRFSVLQATRAGQMSVLKMKESGIIPDVIDDVPKTVVTVKYTHGVDVKMGNELTPKQVAIKPLVEWESNPGKLYTLAMVDPDAPSRATPKARNWLHWLVVNIPGHDISKGHVVTDYAGSTPPAGTSKHRYVFLVFEQAEQLKNPGSISQRAKFDMKKYAKTNNLGGPLAGNFFLAQHA